MAKVLVIGSGGREQALAWKLAESPNVSKVFVAPGNAGSSGIVENIDIHYEDAEGLVSFAKENDIDLSVVGQESASASGVVDAFKSKNLKIFGPDKAAAQIESSKAFSKNLMHEERIPTAQYKNFTDHKEAREYAKSRLFPIVIKADGLATGKGVIIAYNEHDIDDAIDAIMVKKEFGASGETVVIEDFLTGQEVSLHALSDGTNAVLFPASQDHKQIFDGDKGPNTGGMGVVAPLDWVSEETLEAVRTIVVEPALNGLKKKGATFVGCLYPGLMLEGSDISVLEFNARFGDPEAEVYMRLLDGDLYEIFMACVNGRLSPELISWKDGYAATIILASPGYPGSYPKGLPITGIENAEKREDIVIFHSGTAIKDGQLVTAGGRVLNITATGPTLEEALDKAYDAVQDIHFEGMQYRKDIGRRIKNR
jgi:phosphoribosylamine--glycine ligase